MSGSVSIEDGRQGSQGAGAGGHAGWAILVVSPSTIHQTSASIRGGESSATSDEGTGASALFSLAKVNEAGDSPLENTAAE